MEKTADSAYLVISKRLSAAADEISEVNKMISLQEQAYNRYIQEANSIGLSSDLAEKVRNGTIDITKYDKDTQKLIDDYQKFYEAALDCKDALDDLTEQLGDLYKQRFDMQQEDYEKDIKLIEHLLETYETGLDKLEAKGLFASAEYYKSSIQAQEQTVSVLNKELATLIQAMSDGVNSGAIEEGSEAFKEMQIEINNVKEAIEEANLEIIKLNNSIRDLEWEKFDYTLDRIKKLNDEAEFFIELMSHEKLFDDSGNATEQGTATFAMYAQEYNVLMAMADKYGEEMSKVQKELADDPYNQDLIERYEELRESQQECILSAEKMKDSVRDLVKDGIDIELDALSELIDKYNDYNDAQKDLYDYQKKINQQTKEIASLQKQLSALTGDNSQEAKLRTQKLQVQLNEALEELQETETDHMLSEQKKMLDETYNQYETILNERLDNVDALFDAVVNELNTQTGDINSTLSAEAKEVGYTISENMNDIWQNQAYTTLSTYHGEFIVKLTSITEVLNKIAANTTKAEAKADAEAKNTTTTTKTTTTAVKPATSTSTTKTPTTTTSAPKTIQVGSRVKVPADAPIYWDSTGKAGPYGTSQYFKNDPVYYVVKENNGFYALRHHTQDSVAGWFKKSDVTAFKSGGLANYTGPAWMDGTKSKPEAVLNQKDTEMFLALTEALRSIKSNYFKPSLSSGYTNAGNSIGDITINVGIDHVEDYNDFVYQLQNDPKFERMIGDMTIGRMTGKSSLAKYRNYKN